MRVRTLLQDEWVRKELDEAIEDGAWELALRILDANPDLFPVEVDGDPFVCVYLGEGRRG